MTKPVDPYWSLWGRITANNRRVEEIMDSDDMQMGGGWRYKCAEYALEQECGKRFCLPRTLMEVCVADVTAEVNGEYTKTGEYAITVIEGKQTVYKTVKTKTHGVNFLRKLDTDVEYRAAIFAARTDLWTKGADHAHG